jgi:hypothetical protein
VAVLTPDAPDVLSHVSVRARNMKVRKRGRDLACRLLWRYIIMRLWLASRNLRR